jgi:acetate kinase
MDMAVSKKYTTSEVRNSRHILAINCGSSSLKLAFYHLGITATGLHLEVPIFTGTAEHIGSAGGVFRAAHGNHSPVFQQEIHLDDHTTALHYALDWLETEADWSPPDAFGHRFVHGGLTFSQPHFITTDVLVTLQGLTPLAPEHLPSEVAVVEALGKRYPQIPQAACFDTAFHRNMPRTAQLYALPRRLLDEGVVRYGFHGLSYEYIMSELERQAGKDTAHGRVIIAHLGSGASMAAIRDGESMDTTMGFTPLGGLVMSTRSGDLDPGVLLYLLESGKLTPAEGRELVGRQSGLLGLSETSPDMEELLTAMGQDARAEEAVALFCYTARKYLGGLTSVLGGLDTLVFTGGIGEHAAQVRQRICEGLRFLGISLDNARNVAGSPIISTPDSAVTLWVMHTNEELMIARHTARLLDTVG